MGENEGAGPPWDDKKRLLSGHAIDLGRSRSMQKEQQEPMLRKEVGQSEQQKENQGNLISVGGISCYQTGARG